MTEKSAEATVEPVEAVAQTDEKAGAAKEPLSTGLKVIAWGLAAAAALFLWFVGCAVAHAGLYASARMLFMLALIVVAAILIWKTIFVPSGKWPALGLVVALLWLYVVGSYNLGLDLFLLAVTFLVPMLLSDEARGWLKALFQATTHRERYQVILSVNRPETRGGFKKLSTAKGFRICVIFLLSFWVLSSLADAWGLGQPVPRDLANFTRLREKINRESRWPGARVGLALSGGGYRAVLMHAGVLDALERLNVPVTNISTVSGGSIVGAFYATGGTPTQLRDAVKHGRFRLTRSLTDAQNLSQLGFPFQVPGTEVQLFKWYEFSRSDVQADLLDKVLLGGSTFAAMNNAKAAHPDAPELMVCSTDLHTGALFGFHRGGVLRRHLQHAREKLIYKGLTDEEVNEVPSVFQVSPAEGPAPPVQGGTVGGQPEAPLPRLSAVEPVLTPDAVWLDMPLARVVAASGAFPGAFNAMRQQVKVSNRGHEPQTLDLLLADGGITDNSALSIMEYARQKAKADGEGLEGWKNLTLVLSSDASALLSEDEGLSSLGELTRAIDIVYANIGSATWDGKLPKVLLSPAAFLDTRELSNSLKADERQALLKTQVAKVVDRSLAKLDRESLALLEEAVTKTETKKQLAETRASLEAQKAYGTDFVRMSAVRWKSMRDEIVKEFVSCSEVFLRTSTLTDNFEAEDAEALFRLGQFLVAFNWPYMRKQLLEGEPPQPAAVAAVAQAAPAPAEQLAGGASARPAAGPRRRARRPNAAAQPR